MVKQQAYIYIQAGFCRFTNRTFLRQQACPLEKWIIRLWIKVKLPDLLGNNDIIDHPTNPPTIERTDGLIRKFHFQYCKKINDFYGAVVQFLKFSKSITGIMDKEYDFFLNSHFKNKFLNVSYIKSSKNKI